MSRKLGDDAHVNSYCSSAYFDYLFFPIDYPIICISKIYSEYYDEFVYKIEFNFNGLFLLKLT